MKEGMLFFLVGSSGSGKNTVINELLKRHEDVKFLVSQTTRDMRPGEIDGVTYNFVSKEEFEKSIDNNEMLECDLTHKGYYGISKSAVESSLQKDVVVVKDITVTGLVNCKKLLDNEVNIGSVFLTESKKVLRKRLIGRGEKNHRLRLKIYSYEQKQMGLCDYIIKNTHLNDTVLKVEGILNHLKSGDYLLPANTFAGVNAKLLNKSIDKLIKTKRPKGIRVALSEGKIYLLDKPELYLAGLVLGKHLPKRFVDTNARNIKSENDNTLWLDTIHALVFNDDIVIEE